MLRVGIFTRPGIFGRFSKGVSVINQGSKTIEVLGGGDFQTFLVVFTRIIGGNDLI